MRERPSSRPPAGMPPVRARPARCPANGLQRHHPGASRQRRGRACTSGSAVGATGRGAGRALASRTSRSTCSSGARSAGLPGSWTREIESVGGRTNAGTSWTAPLLHSPAASPGGEGHRESWPTWPSHPAFDERELAREREVVFEGDAPRRGQSAQRTGRRLYELIFRGDAHGYPGARRPGDAASRAAARRSAATTSGTTCPDNLTLVVVGAVRPDEVRAAVAHTFAAPSRGLPARVPLAAPPRWEPSGDAYARAAELHRTGLARAALVLSPTCSPQISWRISRLPSSRLNQIRASGGSRHRQSGAGYSALQGAGMLQRDRAVQPTTSEGGGHGTGGGEADQDEGREPDRATAR